MEFSLTNLPLVLALAVAVGIAVLNGFAVFSRGRGRTLMSYSAIILHVPMLALLFFAGAELDFVLLVFLVSTLIYSVMSCIKYSLDSKRAREEEGET